MYGGHGLVVGNVNGIRNDGISARDFQSDFTEIKYIASSTHFFWTLSLRDGTRNVLHVTMDGRPVQAIVDVFVKSPVDFRQAEDAYCRRGILIL